MKLTVLGLGLVSPAGASARDHVFFPRAGAPPPPPSPFIGPDGRRIDARYCPWIRPSQADAGRLLALARGAVAEALAALPGGDAAGIPRFVVAPAPRPGLPEGALSELARALGPAAQRFTGAAGAFAALARIAELLAGGAGGAALLVGVDSFAGVDALAERRRRPESPWLLAPPPPSEGAGALLVASAEQASRWGLAGVGEIVASRYAPGRATDEDDEPVDAAAMTALLRSLPSAAGSIQAVFGQGRVGALRCREWQFTTARCAERLSPSYFDRCLEAEIGELGAAAGVMGLACAFATVRHGAAPPEAGRSFVAWAISRDGTRGIALGAAARTGAGKVAAGAEGALPVMTPLSGAVIARGVEREVFVPPPAEVEEPGDEAWIEEGAGVAGAASSGAANDVAPALPALPRESAPAPAVRLDAGRVIEVTLAGFYASVVDHCAELVAALARDRVKGRRSWLPETEARMLRQIDAIVAAGPRALIDVAAFWERWMDDPWKSFAGALSLAAFAGDDALAAIHRAAHLLPQDAEDHAIAVAEALALVERPGLAGLARALSASAHPIARAAGVNLRSMRGELPVEALAAALADEHDAVVRAGIWGCERLPPAQRARFVERLRELCGGASPDVAWSAARVLVIGGEVGLVRDEALSVRLGLRAAELFPLAGEPGDWPRLESLLGRHRPTRAALSAVARFGCPASAGWIIQRLDDEALADDAAEALRTLFGQSVEKARELDAGAWREAIAALRLDPKGRYRGGREFSIAGAVEECASRRLSRLAVEARIDELRARLRLPDAVDVSGLWARAEANLAAFLKVAQSRG
ncbi:hypothetical protein [Sorangium atrum]|uniref:Beta-ketoacyl synthase N-terminal domain-containing protein n=1 Tax=Sorangium atrum TaxID=2995308 RepID=A0ABT5CDN6_9BACT|nr:hypothetical protein [Sorangium aterium]MDC0684515.1 hypothetical protein [Sorangium aterium]